MLKQSLQQKLLQKLSPQQIQLMKLLQIPSANLEQRIKEEIEQNPALEEGAAESEEGETNEYDEGADGLGDEGIDTENNNDDFDISDYLSDDDIPSYKLSTQNSGPDDEKRDIPISGGMSFQDLLISQLNMRMVDDRAYEIALHLIGSIDNDGYIRRPLNAIVDDLAFAQNIFATEDELKEMLEVLQDFDPPGVGARDLQECLYLQLERKSGSEDQERAKTIIKDHFEEFSKKHYSKIARKLGIEEDDL
ncbi:MAG: RNA polymerase sigma-54 factor, partial [Flavobacteriales bacterium]|nr:RNA polymerase sigma-54 factor [Flavobacteriales bacterium]